MDSRECCRWTFCGVVIAFLELALAYYLLCGSAFVFVASKFLLVFGLDMPCPCSGILGYKNKDLCLHKLLFGWPLTKIHTIQNLSVYRLPCEIGWHREKEEIPSSTVVISDGKEENNVLKTGFRKESSSDSGFRINNLCGRESDSDVRTRQAMNQKQKASGRRRRGKSSSIFSRGNAHLSLDDASGSADNSQADDRDKVITQDEFNLEGPITDGETDETREESSSVKAVTNNDMDTAKKLERALREERTARAALVVELEEERAASATAADEAMAMILRLQADKAYLELEAKQYERMMEEKFAYDEEEMTVLKEILVRREKENHYLEKELEGYKHSDGRLPEEPNVYDVHVVEDI
ncbi:PREDICTED: myosin-binding protein 3-like [Tarenaya hassleriana]|uniref:myosin-binding protein 3-like n=1 Tax=Tarenaya hassleriana TaxID=28532 RepID=UPI00053C5091|nr:PREDICTED: myosin-binding protein 3-like [Tarenaya hassleriana]